VSRRLAIAGAVVALLVALPLLYLDSLAQSILESGASQTFGTQTTLGSVSLGLVSGRVGIGDLRVRNPEGWQANYFFTIGEGRFGIGLSELLAPEVEVPELILEDVHLSLERSPGGSNYGTILSHRKQGPPPPPDAEARRFVIRDVRIRKVEADLRFDGPGAADRELEVRIPEIRLRNLGSDSEGGMLVSQMWSTVLRGVLVAVVRESGGAAGFITRDLAGGLARVGNVPVEIIGAVTSQGGELAVEAGRTAGEKLGEAAGGVVDDAGELGDAAGDAVRRGLGGLLDRKD